MKNKLRSGKLILIAVVLVAGVALLLKPADRGEPYSPYFNTLNTELQQHGPGRPVIVIDLDSLDANISELKRHIRPPKSYRVVDKSLPSFPLINYIMAKTGTNKVMCFHQPFLNAWVRQKPDVEILLGKPMPISAVETFYNNLPDTTSFNCATQIEWLIDDSNRLAQYLQFAISHQLKMKLNVEIDVGLHRGGVNNTATLLALLKQIEANSSHLSFSGFMGYDAHVPEVFFPLGTPQKARNRVLQSYRAYIDSARLYFPAMFTGPLTFNGAGSKTYQMYDSDTLLNDLAAGSGILLPSDFDVATLQNHRPAIFIATPVLKKMPGTKIPFLEFLSPLLSWWNPNLQYTYFIYGGRWKANPYAPKGVQNNGLYGYSSNQQIENSSASTQLKADDYIFFRPTQSEEVMLEFGDVLVIRNGKIIDHWPVFTQ